MTTTNPNVIACPRCRSTSTVSLSGGDVLCIDCRNEWNPARARALSVVPADHPAGTTEPSPSPTTTPMGSGDGDALPDAFVAALEAQTDTTAETAVPSLEDLIGTDVILDGGQRATIVSFPDDDHLEVIIGEGTTTERFEQVELNDVERSVSAPPPAIDVPDDVAAGLAAVNMTIAGLAIRAGLGAIAGTGDDAQLITPPSGWLPTDTDAIAALEQGVAYGIAFLVHGFRLDREIVAAVADTLLADGQQHEPTKGGTNDTGSDSDDNDRNGTGPAGTGDVHGTGDPGDPQ